MDNQHRQIKGYRELTQAEVDLMNDIKRLGESIGGVVAGVRKFPDTDPRWIAIAETHLQQGIMALTRAVARPTTF